MKRYLMAVLGSYAGAAATVYLLYRAAYVRSAGVRSWTEGKSQELTRLLDQLRGELSELRSEVRSPLRGLPAEAGPNPLAAPHN